MNVMFAFKLLFALLASVIGSNATTTCSSNKVTDFIVIHPGSGPAEYSLVTDSHEIDFSEFETCAINIIAKTENYPAGCQGGKQIRCVKIQLGSVVRKEQHEPYSLYGDNVNTGVDYHYGTPDLKKVQQTLKAWTYTDSQCTQNEGGYLKQSIDVHGGILDDFYAWDAKKNTKIGDLRDGDVCLPKSGQVNIEVKADDSCVKSVYLKLTGGTKKDSRTENSAPFLIYGDNPKTHNIYGKDGFVVGTTYTIEATPNGDATQKKSQTFRFKNCA